MTQEYPPPYAEMLDYASRNVGGRPGILTALGVCSIVFGSLGILTNLGGAGSSIWELVVSPEVIVSSPMSPNTSADTTAPNTLTAEESRLIVAALGELQPLDEDERRRLAEAFRKAEAPVAPPLPGVPWTAEHVKGQVIASATHLPGEPYDEEADEGAGEATTQPRGDADAALGASEPEDTYEEREVHFDFGDSGDAWIYADHIDFYAWRMDGSDIDTTVWADGTIEVYDDEDYQEPSGFWWNLQLWMSLLTSLAGFALAVVLIIAGAMTLRDSSSAPRLHRVWAWARLVLSVVATAIGVWGLVQLGDFMGLGEYHWPIMTLAMVVQLLLWCAYPVVVLFVLRSSRVRDWYDKAPLAQSEPLKQ